MAIVLFNISISWRGACRWRGWLLKFSNFSLHFRWIKECHFMAANLLPLNTKFTWFGFFSLLCFLFFSGWSGQSEIGIKTFFLFQIKISIEICFRVKETIESKLVFVSNKQLNQNFFSCQTKTLIEACFLSNNYLNQSLFSCQTKSLIETGLTVNQTV